MGEDRQIYMQKKIGHVATLPLRWDISPRSFSVGSAQWAGGSAVT